MPTLNNTPPNKDTPFNPAKQINWGLNKCASPGVGGNLIQTTTKSSMAGKPGNRNVIKLKLDFGQEAPRDNKMFNSLSPFYSILDFCL